MKKIAVIGGGASGFFGAIRAAEYAKELQIPVEVHIFESKSFPLGKVKISGGGRCNVTHYEFNPAEFCNNYPRGKRELRSPFTQFQAADTVDWFYERGVNLVPEEDGRMFPESNKSETIINCFLKQAEKNNVRLHKKQAVASIDFLRDEERFDISFKEGGNFQADKILIATGSAPIGYKFAKNLGHSITDLAPSLFSFKISHPVIKNLSGVSFENTSLILKTEGKTKFLQTGPTLITHWGLSGPAVLKLSAWGAREMKSVKYKADLVVNWMGPSSRDDIDFEIQQLQTSRGKNIVQNIYPEKLTKRFWINFLNSIDIPTDKKWEQLSKKDINKIVENLYAMTLKVLGQNRFKDEFVECGGVNLKEINFKTMESKHTPGLHFSGEVLDIDGITGGFNFQNAWTTGFIAGTNMVESL